MSVRSLAFRATVYSQLRRSELSFSAWSSEPPCLLNYDVQSRLSRFDVHSYQFIVGRLEPPFPYGLIFRFTISSFWLLEPPLQFDVQIRHLFLVQHSKPSRIFSVWHSESHFHFGIQSRISSLAFEPLFVFSSAFRAIMSLFRLTFRVAFSFRGSEPSSLLRVTCGTYLFRHVVPPYFLLLAFKATFPQPCHS